MHSKLFSAVCGLCGQASSTASRYNDTSKGYFAFKWHQSFCTACYFKEVISKPLWKGIVLILPKAAGHWSQVRSLLRVLIGLSQNRCKMTYEASMSVNNSTSSPPQPQRSVIMEETRCTEYKGEGPLRPCLLSGRQPSCEDMNGKKFTMAVPDLGRHFLHSTGR